MGVHYVLPWGDEPGLPCGDGLCRGAREAWGAPTGPVSCFGVRIVNLRQIFALAPVFWPLGIHTSLPPEHGDVTGGRDDVSMPSNFRMAAHSATTRKEYLS
jgi:hypothetical protein